MTLIDRASRFDFNLPKVLPKFVGPEYSQTIFRVERHGKDRWIISMDENIYDQNKCIFVYRPFPSETTSDFIKNTRFEFYDAIKIAEKIERGQIIPFEEV